MRVLIVDDHPALRAGMRGQILSEWPDAEVQEAPTLARGLALVDRLMPDLMVIDLSLPDGSGLHSVSRVLNRLNGMPLLVLCHEADREEAARLLEMGVAGYLPKPMLASELLPALRRLRSGGRFVGEALSHRFLRYFVV